MSSSKTVLIILSTPVPCIIYQYQVVLYLFMRYPDGTAPPRKEGNIKIMDYFFEYVGKVRSQSLVEISKKTNTPSARKYLSSKWIKGNVSRRILVLDTSLFIHFDDKYFRMEGVYQEFRIVELISIDCRIVSRCNSRSSTCSF